MRMGPGAIQVSIGDPGSAGPTIQGGKAIGGPTAAL